MKKVSELTAFDFDGGTNLDPRRCFFIGEFGIEVYYNPNGNKSDRKEFVGTVTWEAMKMALRKMEKV